MHDQNLFHKGLHRIDNNPIPGMIYQTKILESSGSVLPVRIGLRSMNIEYQVGII